MARFAAQIGAFLMILLRDAVGFAGLAAILRGIWMLSEPAALIAGGLVCVSACYLLARRA